MDNVGLNAAISTVVVLDNDLSSCHGKSKNNLLANSVGYVHHGREVIGEGGLAVESHRPDRSLVDGATILSDAVREEDGGVKECMAVPAQQIRSPLPTVYGMDGFIARC